MNKRPSFSLIESGEPWIGMVPSYWEKIRIKFCLTSQPKVSDPTLPAGAISFGRVIQKSDEKITAETKATYRVVEKGDFLINPINLNYDLKSLRTALSALNVCVSSAYLVAKAARFKDSPHFLKYLLYVFDILHMKTLGAGVRQTITLTDIGNCFWCLPDLQEQRQIATYLNRETAKIDKLIAKQQKLITLLQEKRQAVISQAVTKGLDPHVRMKDSGVDCLGLVPEHWKVCQIKRLVRRIEQGWSPQCDAIGANEDSWGVLKVGCVNGGVFNEQENKALPPHIEPIPTIEVKRGDVLVSRASGSPSLVGSAALVGDVRPKLMLSDKLFRIHFSKSCFPEYFVLVMTSKVLRTQIESALSGGNGLANNLPQSSLLGFFVAVPPVHTQVEIVGAVNKKVSKLKELEQRCKAATELMLEHRQALITAAVTGKIDVRGLVTDEEVAALDADPVLETTEEDFESEVAEADYITEEE